MLHVRKMNIYPAYISNEDSGDKKQIILLMIINGKGWHYLALKTISIINRIKFKT